MSDNYICQTNKIGDMTHKSSEEKGKHKTQSLSVRLLLSQSDFRERHRYFDVLSLSISHVFSFIRIIQRVVARSSHPEIFVSLHSTSIDNIIVGPLGIA